MKRNHLLTAVLLIPAALYAGVDIHVSVGTSCNHVSEYDRYVDDGEPWFEEYHCNGPSRVSFEYQWAYHGPRKVLRYRQVSFNLIEGVWVFGPWNIKANYCHPSCKVRHKHVYYRRVSHPNWCRVYDTRSRTYYYEYRSPQRNHSRQAKVYRYEYRPHQKEHKVHKETKHNSGCGHNNDRNGSHNHQKSHEPQRSDNKRSHTSTGTKQSQVQQQKSTVTITKTVSKSDHTSHKQHNRERSSIPDSRDGQIVRISGR